MLMPLITLTLTASAEDKMVLFPKESQVEKVVRSFPNVENSPKVVNEQIAVALSSPLNFH